MAAHHAQCVICTHLMLTLTPSLPFPRCLTLHVQAQLRCRVAVTAPIGAAGGCPSHPTSSSSSSFSTSPSLRYQVCVCASVCWWRGRKGCFTQPQHRPLASNSRLVAACLCWWLRGGGCVTVRVAAPHPPPPRAMLCCLLVPAWHVLLTPSRIRTFVFATWARHRLQIGRSRQVFVCCACSFQLLLVL